MDSRRSWSVEHHALNSEEVCKCTLHRLASFVAWPQLLRLSACTFATAGFVYVGRGDEVTCSGCGLSLAQWTPGTHPLAAHRVLSTKACTFAGRRVATCNVRYGRCDNARSPRPTSRLTSRGREADGWRRSAAASVEGNTSPSAAADGDARVDAPAAATAPQSDGAIIRCFRKLFVDMPLPTSIGFSELLTIPTAAGLAASGPHSRRSRERRPLSSLPKPREEALKYETFRLSTFMGVWEHSSIVDPRELAQAGFFYIGPGDRVQCAFCQGLLRKWEPGDRASTLHAKYFTYCRFVQGHDVGNVPIPFSALEHNWPEHEDELEEGLGISRSTPRHTDMAVEALRLATFATWPPDADSPGPDELAAAGFFYFGDQNAVKCFYCDVVVSAWPMGSNAWVEHAKRSSSCLFLDQVKGADFVQQHRADGAGEDHGALLRRRGVDPREIRARLDSPAVYILLQMEYPLDLVREAIQKRLATVGDDFSSSEGLLASMFDIHDERERSENEATAVRRLNNAALPVIVKPVSDRSDAAATAAAAIRSASVPSISVSAGQSEQPRLPAGDFAQSLGSNLPALLSNAELPPTSSSSADPGRHFASATGKQGGVEENRQLKTQLTCKICMDSLVGIVFLPCGHFVCCPACAPAITSCPICRVVIRGTVRTYI